MTFGAVEAYYIMPVMLDLPFSARGLKLKNGTCHPLSIYPLCVAFLIDWMEMLGSESSTR